MKRLLAICLSLALADRAEAVVDHVAPPNHQAAQDRSPPADDAHCTTCDGVRLLQEGQYDRAMHVFLLRSAAGDPVAMNNIGYMYEEGLGVAVDYNRARQYFTKAMNVGGSDGMANLGIMYQHGLGVPVDYGHAMRLYHQAIVAGASPLAMNQIGFMLQHGLGAPADPKQAWCWYLWADANGQPNAPTHFAELTAAGQQPVQDCSVLNQWPVKARPRATATVGPVRRQP